MTLPEIEAMQAMLTETALRKRAEEGVADGAQRHRPPEHDTRVAFIGVREEEDFKAVGPL